MTTRIKPGAQHVPVGHARLASRPQPAPAGSTPAPPPDGLEAAAPNRTPTSDPTRLPAGALTRARTAQATGDVEGAWGALAQGADGFAKLMAAALHERSSPGSYFTQTTDAQWQHHLGEGLAGAKYQAASGALLERYLSFVEHHGALPDTEDIEHLDRAVMESQGLPLVLATGSYLSKLEHQFHGGFSWGLALGLPRERIETGSRVFADAPFDALGELLKVAWGATRLYGTNVRLALDGAAATLRGFSDQSDALTVSAPVLEEARRSARQGDVAQAWQTLARHGDGYATQATEIISERDDPRGFFAQVVGAHWLRVVGPQLKREKFMPVAQRHLDNYLAQVSAAAGRLPDTRQIEASYRDAVESNGLPALLAVDSLLSRADLLLEPGLLGRLGLRDLSWAAMAGVPPQRIVRDSDVFADLDFDPVRELAATALAVLRQHGLRAVGADAVGALWRGARDLLSGDR